MIPRTLIVVTTTLLAATIVIGAELPYKTNNAIAQVMGNVTSGMATRHGMMGMGPGMMAGNQSMTTQIMKPSQNITGSINLMNIIPQAIGSKVNVSLSEAITAAEGIGNNSHAVTAYLGEENGYLVYNIMVIDPRMNFSKVIVDPGNGHLLFSKQLSKEDMRGPQQGRGMMMGPMTAQAQQTDNINSSNATSKLPTTNATINATSPAAVVSTPEPSATTTVSMARGSQFPSNPEFYVPAEITVKPGQTVTWRNDDTAIHTATSGQDFSPDGKFDTSFVSPGQSSKPIAMPTQPGQYPYFCTLHPWMTGTVTVG